MDKLITLSPLICTASPIFKPVLILAFLLTTVFVNVGAPVILQTGLTGFRPLCGRAGAAARYD